MAAIDTALNNRRTRIKIARNSVSDCPVGRQMTSDDSVSNDFDQRSSIVLLFSVAAYLV